MDDSYSLVKSLFTQVNAAYRKAQFADAIQFARHMLTVLGDCPSLPDHAVMLDSAYRRMIEALDRSNQFETALAELNAWENATKRPEGRADALALRARLSYRRGDYQAAIRYVDEGTSLAQTAGYSAGLATLFRFRADVLWIQGHAEQALLSAQQALAIYEGLDDLEGRARALNTISAVFHMLGNQYKSIKYALQAVTILEAINDQTGMRVVYSNLGESYQQIYCMDKALAYHEKAMLLSGENADPDLIRNLGVDLVAVGRTEEGVAHLRNALARAREIGETDQVMQALHSLAEALFNTGQKDEARKLATELLEMAQPLDALRHIIRALLLLGYCARDANDPVSAQEYMHEGFMVAQRSNDKAMIWQTHAALAEMLESSQPSIAAVHATIASDMVNIMMYSIEDDVLQEMFRRAAPVARVLKMAHHGRRF